VKPPVWSFTPFKGLKDALDNNKCVTNKTTAPNMKTDEEIFLDAMADVREIKQFRAMPPKQPPKITLSRFREDDSIEDLRRVVRGELRIRLSDTGEYIGWVRSDTRRDIIHRLHRGDFAVQDYIDLHGFTLNEAEEAMSLFLKEALRKRLFCIKVIHGRGLRSPDGPVLKRALERLLQGRFRKCVIAYSTAKACDGGLGASYVLLRAK
jgi:DNA-nicking Smr family endonuclease